MDKFVGFAKKIWCMRKPLFIVAAPLILLPVTTSLPPKEGKCLYVVLLMALYWCTEALPLAVTALLPVGLFPYLGILPSKKICPQYFLETNFLFLSGLIMAGAIENWNLHRRIALRILLFVGTQPARLILGMMFTSGFLSMWLSNTATTAMMLPIATAILKSLFSDTESSKESQKFNEENTGVSQLNGLPSVSSEMQRLTKGDENKDLQEKFEVAVETQSDLKEMEEEYKKSTWKGFLISIPYAASIGGTATLTGTSPNLLLLGQLKSFFPDCEVLNFGSWFLFSLPLVVIFLLAGWLWISFMYGGLGPRFRKAKNSEVGAEVDARVKAVIKENYQKLGSMTFAEKAVGFFFFIFAVLLFTRDPKFFPGWASLFKAGFVTDGVTGVTIVIILFFFPSQKPSFKWWLDFKAPNTVTEPLLSWKKVQESVPWNLILLLGGGFAMAKGCEESGLSIWIGTRLQPLENLSPGLAVLLITVVIASFTEFASNTATIVIFLPVLAELAIRLKVNPLYLMIPGTVGCSYAFMLPVSTPPNSIAFASGHLLVKDMDSCSYAATSCTPPAVI
nr:PREDICTED: solute carrier family 13 member 3 isoform X2 [Latimeria chalumnae]|eukprot:XP_014346572.1 PREDICTED: solute carrier family 13 member 3 isoform X2 [Latimeria chalumnae]